MVYFTLEIKSVLAKPYFSTYLVGKSVLDGRQIDTDTFLRGRFVVRKTGGQRCHHYKSFQGLKWSETLRLVLLFSLYNSSLTNSHFTYFCPSSKDKEIMSGLLCFLGFIRFQCQRRWFQNLINVSLQ